MWTVTDAERMRDHWWWRPGHRSGRHYHACHFAMGRHRELAGLVRTYQKALEPFTGLDLIPLPWLHLTMQPVGFLDEVGAEELRRLWPVLGQELAAVPAPLVTLHRPVVRAEAIYLPAVPAEPILAVRLAVRKAIGEVLGPQRVPESADQVAGFRPHVSIAYANTGQDARPVAAALAAVVTEPVLITLDQVELMRFHRDNRMYEWRSAEPLPIGAATG